MTEDKPTLAEVTDPIITDESAMDAIHMLLDGGEWEATTIELVAQIVEQSGRHIREPHETPYVPWRAMCHTEGCDQEIINVVTRPDGDSDYICKAGHKEVQPF